MACAVDAVRSVDLGVPDIERSAKFYTEIWGLARAGGEHDSIYLRGCGPHHHVLGLHRRSKPEILRLTLTAPDKDAVAALYAAVSAAGVAEIESPAAIDEPGGGYGFGFKDPEGRGLRIVAGDLRQSDASLRQDRPSRIAHVVLNTRDLGGLSDFYCQVLGFRENERADGMSFLRCNADHHSIALFRAEAPTLNHIAFVMRDAAEVMRGAERLRRHGFEIGWGVGQHGAGEPLFAYFIAPDDVVIEYTAEVPAGWAATPKEVPLWGVAKRPTEGFIAAQCRLAWAPGLFHSAA